MIEIDAVCVIVSWILSFSRTRSTSPRSVRIRRHFVRSGCCGSPHHPSPADNVRSDHQPQPAHRIPGCGGVPKPRSPFDPPLD